MGKKVPLVDLSNEGAPPRKRQRTEPDDDVIIIDDDDDDEAGPMAAPPGPPGPSSAAPVHGNNGDLGDDDLGDDDLLITSEKGQEALKDFPHSRHSCGKHRFAAPSSTSNAVRCPQCFCFVCDVNARDCAYWGTGARPRDHANAHASPYWSRLRAQARLPSGKALIQAEYASNAAIPGAAVDQPAAGTSGNAAAAPAHHAPLVPTRHAPPPPVPARQQTLTAALETMQQRAQEREAERRASKAAAAAAPAAAPGAAPSAPPCKEPMVPSKLKPLPHPDTDPLAFELGTLQFSVKAAEGHTIESLSRRLQSTGFYFTSNAKPEDRGSMLDLETILDSRYEMRKGKYKNRPIFLKLHSLPTPADEQTPLTDLRTRKVLVVDSLGRTQAKWVGVRITSKAKRQDLLVALSPVLQPAFSASQELLHLVVAQAGNNDFFSYPFIHYAWLRPETVLDDAFFERNACTLVVFRTRQHPKPTWKAGRAATAGTQTHAVPTYLHEGKPSRPPAGSSYYSSNMKHPSWVLVVSHRRTAGAPRAQTEEEMLIAMMAGYLDTRSRTEPYGHPILVPLDLDHAHGSADADSAARLAVAKAMEAYRTSQPMQASAEPVLYRHNNSASSIDERPENRWARPNSTALRVYETENSLQTIGALWDEPLPVEVYDMQAFAAPATHSSASEQVMAETQATIDELKRRESNAARRRSLPLEALSELRTLARRGTPPVKDSGLPASCPEPHAAVVLKLEASSAGHASAREGKLTAKIYTWKSDCSLRRSLFRLWDDWPSLGKRDYGVGSMATRIMEGIMLNSWQDPPPPVAGAAGSSAMVAAAAAAAAGPGPSTSAAAAAAATAAPSSAASSGAVTAGQRARDMYAEVQRVMGKADASRSINGLLEFMQTGDRPPAPAPAGLTVSLHNYQLQSLGFMLEAERRLGAGGGYRELFWIQQTNSRGQTYWYSPVLDRLALDVPAAGSGGFLAEEMGLGKTVEVMALILSNPAPPNTVSGAKSACGRILSRATLVVCAVSLVGQWADEANNKTQGNVRIHQYHGPSRQRDPARLATEYDVVVTTYQTLQSDHRSDRGDPCQAIKWHRIVFDEGHTLRSASTKLAKAAIEMSSDRKWLCTGTPINNGLDDLLGQFAGVHLMPLGKQTYFNSYVKMPFLSGYGSRNGMVPLLYALSKTMIRHTKKQHLGGQEVLQLPAKTETLVAVHLTHHEQELYKRVHRTASKYWLSVKQLGHTFVNQHLFSITSMLMPMRRVCSGGMLGDKDLAVSDPHSRNGEEGGGGGADGSDGVLVPPDVADCPICTDQLNEPTVTPCNHWYCRECIESWLQASAHHNCPACRLPFTVAQLRRGKEPEPEPGPDEAGPSGAGGGAAPTYACESKLRVLLRELRAMREADVSAKALVFTQFNQTLEWLKRRLAEEGFGYRTISGDMTLKKRTEAIESFQKDPPTTVFLLSVRSGAVGINLTSANYVFLMEPCMNPAMEEQAIGRAWRMGQQRPVTVKKFYVQGSVEERIMEVVKMRRAAGSAVAGGETAPPPPSRHHKGAAAGVVAGNLRQDKADLKVNELDLLFKDPDFPPAGPSAFDDAVAAGAAAGPSGSAPAAAPTARPAGGIPFPPVGGGASGSGGGRR